MVLIINNERNKIQGLWPRFGASYTNLRRGGGWLLWNRVVVRLFRAALILFFFFSFFLLATFNSLIISYCFCYLYRICDQLRKTRSRVVNTMNEILQESKWKAYTGHLRALGASSTWISPERIWIIEIILSKLIENFYTFFNWIFDYFKRLMFSCNLES